LRSSGNAENDNNDDVGVEERLTDECDAFTTAEGVMEKASVVDMMEAVKMESKKISVAGWQGCKRLEKSLIFPP
jgi:hypothetical protein